MFYNINKLMNYLMIFYFDNFLKIYVIYLDIFLLKMLISILLFFVKKNHNLLIFEYDYRFV